MIVSLVSLVRPSLLHVQPGHGGVIVPGVASVSLVQVGSPMCRPAAFLTDGTSVMDGPSVCPVAVGVARALGSHLTGPPGCCGPAVEPHGECSRILTASLTGSMTLSTLLTLSVPQCSRM